MLSPRLLVGGLLSYLPLARFRTVPSEGTVPPRYCYSVWLRHHVALAQCGVRTWNADVVELGPANSMGAGVAALLTGARSYTALDAHPHVLDDAGARVVDEIAALLRARAPIPGPGEFPNLQPAMTSYAFPEATLPAGWDGTALSPERVHAVRRAVAGEANGAELLRYLFPWSPTSIARASVDVVFSQAVLQEIGRDTGDDAVRETFRATAAWLRPGGVVSHQIDLSAYDGPPWYRHLTYGDATWTVVRGRRPHSVNREPPSAYVRMCEEAGLRVIRAERTLADAPPPASALAPRFRGWSDEDLATRGLHLVAVKD